MKTLPTKRPRETRSDATRSAILQAAVREFSMHGLSGARIDEIAAVAKANKALLYYYFRSKEGLYAAALEAVSEKALQDMLAALDSQFSPGERLLRAALTHFDRILTQQEFQSLMQQEMMRLRQGGQTTMPDFFRKTFRPAIEKMLTTIKEGITAGELCPADPMQVMYTVYGANVFYFLSAPVVQAATSFKPMEPAAIRKRRRESVRLLGSSLFRSRTHGAALVARVLATMPMPSIKEFKVRRKTP